MTGAGRHCHLFGLSALPHHRNLLPSAACCRRVLECLLSCRSHNIFPQMRRLSLAPSAMFMLFSSGAILLTTQLKDRARRRDQLHLCHRHPVYVSIYNIFLSLLGRLAATAADGCLYAQDPA